jgi:hypothetical protein
MHTTKTQLVIKILLTSIIAILTLYISPFYFNGDQYNYIKIYKDLMSFNLVDGYFYYLVSLGTAEFSHFFITWIFSNLNIDKVIFNIITNSLLAYAVISLMQKWKVSLFIIVSIVIFNFYFFVLYFAAERLKFGIFFLVLFVLKNENYKDNTKYIYLSIVSHAQMLLIYGSFIFSSIVLQFLNLKISKRLIFILIITIILLIPMYNHILYKLQFYIKFGGFENIFKPTIFFLLTFYYSKNKMRTFLVFLIIIFSAYILGDERITIFAYFIFLYYALHINRGLNFGVILTSIYFSYKSIAFINNIFIYGQGY